MSIFETYSNYYDLLYIDKNYPAEVKYIDKLIQRLRPGVQTILDLGCGTGRHALLFAERGYKVHGVDISKGMLSKAKGNEKLDALCYSEGDIRNIRLKKSFDLVISLFHVISYQITNEDVLMAFKTAAEHLCHNGLFLFDCWYGPAVLNEKPAVRVKRFENQEYNILRIAEPSLNVNDNNVRIEYSIIVKEKANGIVTEANETHKMRYFFIPEIRMMLAQANLKLIGTYAFMTDKKLSQKTWSAFFIGVKT